MGDISCILKILIDSPSKFACDEIERIQNLDDNPFLPIDRLCPSPVTGRKRHNAPMVDVLPDVELDSPVGQMEDKSFIEGRLAADFRMYIQHPPWKSIKLHCDPSDDDQSDGGSLLPGEKKAIPE